MFRFKVVAFAVVVTAIAHLPAQAHDHELLRQALVIGNSAYEDTPLRNPVNDARAVAESFRRLGFAVSSLENANKAEMEDAIIRFASKLSENTAGIFYYAGHGVQVRGRNYLIPIGATPNSESDVPIRAIDVDLVLDEMTRARVFV